MKSLILIEIDSEGKSENATITTTSFIEKKASDIHKNSVESLKNRIDKIIEKASS